jgi:Transposase DDE domain group 1
MFRELASATYGPEVKMNGLSCRRELLAVTVLLVGLLGLVKFYNGRGTAEQWIKEGKNALRWTRLSCHAFRHNAVRLQLHALAYNLANFVRTLALPEEVEHWSLTTVREKLVKIGARVVRHGRYVVFQLAEVAVPRTLFAEILRRIDRLRPRAAAAPGMSIESDERRQLDGRGASLIDRKPFENGSNPGREREEAVLRGVSGLARALGAFACASERHIVGVQEPAYGKCRFT